MIACTVSSPSAFFPRELSPLRFQAERHQAVMARVRRSARAPSGVVVVVSFIRFDQADGFARELCHAHRVTMRHVVGFEDVIVPASRTLLALLRGADATTWQAIETF